MVARLFPLILLFNYEWDQLKLNSQHSMKLQSHLLRWWQPGFAVSPVHVPVLGHVVKDWRRLDYINTITSKNWYQAYTKKTYPLELGKIPLKDHRENTIMFALHYILIRQPVLWDVSSFKTNFWKKHCWTDLLLSLVVCHSHDRFPCLNRFRKQPWVWPTWYWIPNMLCRALCRVNFDMNFVFFGFNQYFWV